MHSSIQQEAKSYNSLLPITAANLALVQLGEDEVVGRVLSVIHQAGLGDKLGVRLLHKHNDVFDDEVMHESVSVDDEGFALTTSATKCSEIDAMVPNSWQLVGDEYVPVEFSDPKLIENPLFDLSEHAEVFGAIANILRENSAEHILGPCLNYSSYVDDHAPYEKSAFLEKTDTDSRSNVVRYVELTDPSFVNSAKTKWRAVQVPDETGKLVWTTACNCFCSVSPKGGHEGTTTHRYTP